MYAFCICKVNISILVFSIYNLVRKTKAVHIMFKVEKNNAKIGKYLADIIEQKYDSRRAFCRAYIRATGEEPTNETINNMSNRLMQIAKGNKAIQTYDLPYFTELLGISCEQILSAGECSAPLTNRVTNYSIACSNEPKEWDKYINREDKLILNSDEYCKTVLDYALEFGNYEFIKYLMDNKYIWFDSRKDQDYIQTFGAGTSIERRQIGSVDYGLQGKLHEEDELRINLISLACDNNDIQMLNALRARENPQLYFRTHYLSGQHPDFDSCYNERMVKHIAESNEFVLNYFTDSFEIRDNVRYKDGSNRTHTFMFPYISKLLDQLIIKKSPFTETALKKALNYNKRTYKKLCELILSVKNDEYYSAEYLKDAWKKACKDELKFYENGDIVTFTSVFISSNKQYYGIITNVPHVTKEPSSPILKYLTEELNESYLEIVNLKEHLEEL